MQIQVFLFCMHGCLTCVVIFLYRHRHAVDHRCSGLTVKPKYMSATAEHVQKILGTYMIKKLLKPRS